MESEVIRSKRRNAKQHVSFILKCVKHRVWCMVCQYIRQKQIQIHTIKTDIRVLNFTRVAITVQS